MKIKQNPTQFLKIVVGNFLQCIFCVSFVTLFQMLFGPENTLAGVAIVVGITMYPGCYTGLKPLSMFIAIIVLITGSGIVGQLYLFSPWIAFPVNFLFAALIMTLTSQPAMLQPAIVYLLSFVFCQSTAVPMELFPRRFLSCFLGGLLVAVVTVIWWKKKGYGEHGNTLKEHARECLKHPGFILRMSFGLSIAMFIGMIFHLKKPLWISIVVMSLTQLKYEDTKERIKNRSIGTLCGFVLFILIVKIILPESLHGSLVLFLGYLGYFTAKYRYKQIINAICALNASMLLLDTPHALLNRALCLLAGIAIVIVLWKLERAVRKLYEEKKSSPDGELSIAE